MPDVDLERLPRIEEKLDRIFETLKRLEASDGRLRELLYGNGKVGLVERVGRLETTQGHLTKVLFVTSGAVVAQVLNLLLT